MGKEDLNPGPCQYVHLLSSISLDPSIKTSAPSTGGAPTPTSPLAHCGIAVVNERVSKETEQQAIKRATFIVLSECDKEGGLAGSF
jgi:hypothetical protein